MNVLFVCTYNVGRSQMAAALYNKYAEGGHADSAGTIVGGDHGQTIAERAQSVGGALNVLATMDEEGVDIRDSARTQIDESMMDNYDKVVVMAEQSTIPDWLRRSDKFTYWEIEDPRKKDLADTKATKEQIKRRVLNLINQEGKP